MSERNISYPRVLDGQLDLGRLSLLLLQSPGKVLNLNTYGQHHNFFGKQAM
jgi:hypothetical protein